MHMHAPRQPWPTTAEATKAVSALAAGTILITIGVLVLTIWQLDANVLFHYCSPRQAILRLSTYLSVAA